MIELSAEEREKFAAYLREHSLEYQGLVEISSRLLGEGMEAMARRNTLLAGALKITADWLMRETFPEL